MAATRINKVTMKIHYMVGKVTCMLQVSIFKGFCFDLSTCLRRLSSYHQRSSNINEVEAELMSLTKTERKLAEFQDVVKIRGKVG